MAYSFNKRDEIIKKYFRVTNMSCSEMKRWAENPLSKKASLDRSPINRNIELLCNKNWNGVHYAWANKTISYLARSKKINRASKEIGEGYTRNEIAMKNWAYDIKK